MKMKYFECLCLASLLWLGRSAQAQPTPEFIRYTFTGDSFFLAISPVTNQWMGVDVSSEVKSWSNLVNLITANDSSPAIYVDDSANTAARRLYRVRVPGTTVEEARSVWESQGLDSYRFHLQHTSFSRFLVMTGTVAVTNGTKTVTEVEVNGEPTSEFDPVGFPSIEELFALLEEVETQGVRWAWAQYDANLGFPSRCLIDERSAQSTFFSQFDISELAPVGP